MSQRREDETFFGDVTTRRNSIAGISDVLHIETPGEEVFHAMKTGKSRMPQGRRNKNITLLPSDDDDDDDDDEGGDSNANDDEDDNDHVNKLDHSEETHDDNDDDDDDDDEHHSDDDHNQKDRNRKEGDDGDDNDMDHDDKLDHYQNIDEHNDDDDDDDDDDERHSDDIHKNKDRNGKEGDDDDDNDSGHDNKLNNYQKTDDHNDDDDDERHSDDDHNKEDGKDKEGDTWNDLSISNRYKGSFPLSKERMTDTPGNSKHDLVNSIQPTSQKKKNARLSPSTIAILKGLSSKVILKENQQPLIPKELNSVVSEKNLLFQKSKKILNLSDSDNFSQPPVNLLVSQGFRNNGNRRSSTFHLNKPIPPPIGFSPAPSLSITKSPSLFFNDKSVTPKHYNRTSVCPLLQVRKLRMLPENVHCVPRNRSFRSCLKAFQDYDLGGKPLTCGNSPPEEPMCLINIIRQFPNLRIPVVACNTSLCGTNPVYVLEYSPIYGILEERHLWKRFFTSRGLEKYLERYINTNYTLNFNFYLLLCVRKGRTGFIEQLMTFPIAQKTTSSRVSDEAKFNLNILVLDSVSRPHFYRTLPKTVTSLREIDHLESYNATVMDFELLHSLASYTFPNIRALMSGRIDLSAFGRHENETYGIEVLFGKFKQLGYYTLLQEDSCWYDSWGSLFTDNVYQGNMPRYKHEFANRWKRFLEKVKNYNIDDFGLSHASCEIFKRHKTTNQFNHPKKVCFDGKPFAEYFLDYNEKIYNNVLKIGKKTRLLSYTHLNTGHEITGSRIRQIDKRLSQYIKNMAKMEDTLTIVLSDHGPKTTKYSFHTREGRTEKYDPLFFIVIPDKVAAILGRRTLHALEQNQNRIINTLDIHNGLMSLGKATNSSSLKDKGIFDLIPANRTCADLPRKPLAVCKCQGWETNFPDNDKRFTWLAEFALGTINNQIQEQFLRGDKQAGGYGNCQRLVGESFTKIRRRSQGKHYVTTMDIIVTPGQEIFEVQIKYPRVLKNQNSFAKLIVHERVTIYRHFRKCVDTTVSLGLCVCDSKKHPKQKTKQRWIKIKNREDVLNIISRSNSFGSQTRIKDIHQSCLLLFYRNRRRRSTSFEISNTCNDRTYKVTISLIEVDTNRVFVSRKVPFSIFLPRRTIHFLLAIRRLGNTSHNFRLRVKHAVQFSRNR